MKTLQKFILPLLVLAIIGIIYTVYFSPKEGLGSFSDFDPNNNAVKDIRVKLIYDRGITRTQGGGAVFFVSDKDNNVLQVNADKIPPELDSVEIIILKGHLSQNNSFHAHDVLLD
jgi:cytochrome c-type biogenesis protein CcmE